MSDKITNQQISYLKVVLTSQLLLEANEEMFTSTRYNQALKQQINRVNRLLEPIVRESFDTVYNTDPEMTTNILNKIESVIDKIKSSNLDELVIIDSIIDKYLNNKEWFLQYAESDFLRLDN